MCVLLVIGAAIPSTARTKMPPVLAACSAFAPDGTSAMATVAGDALDLSTVDLAGRNTRLTLSLKYPANQWQLERLEWRLRVHSCSLFFDQTSTLVAVAVTTEYQEPPEKFQLSIADVKAARWLSDSGVEAGKEVSSRLTLAGFLKDTDTVVVVRSSNSVKQGEVSILLFRAVRHPVSSEPQLRSLAPFTPILPPFYADGRNNRLWVFHCTVISGRASQQPFCPIDATTLAGGQEPDTTFDPSHSGIKRSDLWELPRTFAAPDQHTILIAASDTVWRVDTDTQQLTRFVLPHSNFLKWNFEHDGTISPDGASFGFLLGQYRIAFPYIVDNYAFEGDDIVVLQVNPLRLLGVVKHGGVKYTAGLSIDHRNGKTTVVVYRQDKWERNEFRDVQP
jgi:hypothetical protein